MNPDVKARWVEALRSGNYKQGKQALYHAGRFCCLGVLCDLAVKDEAVEKSGEGFGSEKDGFAKLLPPTSVLKWAGVERGFTRDVLNDLATKNDDGVSFAEIADAIEAQL